jgi:class 3 adenylate cyclase/tetratricopeptide (TPR) repeat protein
MVRCEACGHENRDGAKFCEECAASLATPEASSEVRKTVTVVFCDVTGSTAMGERLDPEAVRRVMGRYFDEMKAVLESHGGTVEKFIGDAVMAIFGVPQVHEDDALRAVRAAADMRERLLDLNKELERDFGVTIASRIGVNTGEVVSGTGDQTLATGDAVNVAARLEQVAQPGEILIGEDTRRLVRDAIVAEPVEALELKGKAERVPAFRMVSVAGAEGIARRFDAALVGRQGELQVLHEALQRAERDRACWLVTVLGPAGVGKSRLVQEFLEREAARVSIIRGRCLPYGDGITYWPVVEMLTASAQIADLDGPDAVRTKIAALLGDVPDASTVTERLAQFLGLEGATAAPDETHWAVRKLFEAIAGRSTLVAVFDDIHSAEPALLDLIEHIADWSRDAPILVLCTARPELLDGRPGWGGGKLNATSFLLEPLTEAECDELIGNLLERAELPEEARRTITDAAGGNPLFVEQMVGMLIDDGLLLPDGDGWTLTGDLTRVAVPPSIVALLEARLDRLSPEERATMERASIEGKIFHLGGVSALSPDADRPRVRERLMALVRRDLIRPDRSMFVGDDAFRFRHLLIRDAAYRRMPKERRAELHETHAGWLEGVASDRVAEFEEILAYHLEQAYRLRSELGPSDDRLGSLAGRAAERLFAAGLRAFDRGDIAAAVNLLGRAIELLPAGSPERARMLPDLARCLERTGEFERADEILAEAIRVAKNVSDLLLECRARLIRLWVRSRVDVTAQAELLAEAERLVPILEELGDDRALAETWSFIGSSLFWLGRCRESEKALSQALAHAEAAADRRLIDDVSVYLIAPIEVGPTPADLGIQRIEGLIARSGGSKRIESFAKVIGGELLAMRGEFERAREWCREGRATMLEIGERTHAAASSMFHGHVELIADDPIEAERVLREGIAELEAMGERTYLSTVFFNQAEVLYAQGKLDEADAATRRSEENTAPDDVLSLAGWRWIRARVLADRRQLEEAEALAREAVEIIDRTDYLVSRGEAREALAHVLTRAGRVGEAVEALRDAQALHEEKGNLVSTARVRQSISELPAG